MYTGQTPQPEIARLQLESAEALLKTLRRLAVATGGLVLRAWRLVRRGDRGLRRPLDRWQTDPTTREAA
jgi:hypothetical protein